MNILITSVRTVMKRPFIVIFTAVVILFYLLLTAYNPLIPIISGILSFTGKNTFDSIMSVFQVVLDPGFIPGMLLVLLAFALIVSLLAGVLLSGFMNILSNTVDNIGKQPHEFGTGFYRFFFRIFFITLRSVLVAEFLAVFLIIACVPAIIVTRAVMTDKPDLMLAAVFVDFLTSGVLFFGLMFFRAYIFFWYPAAVKNIEKPFLNGKRFADMHFWRIAGRLLIFDIIFAAFQYIIYLMHYALLQFISGWIFDTCFFTCLAIYVFNYFRSYYINAGKANSHKS